MGKFDKSSGEFNIDSSDSNQLVNESTNQLVNQSTRKDDEIGNFSFYIKHLHDGSGFADGYTYYRR